MASTVKIEGVSKAYTKDVPVLLPLDVEVKKGELFFLLGYFPLLKLKKGK